MAIIFWNKKYRETLGEMLHRFRKENKEFKDSKITYAGRLDPLAEGLMILLTDNDVHKKEQFLGLDKVYQVEFFLGSKTDSYDILGFSNSFELSHVELHELNQAISTVSDITEQEYPAYSSKTVDGVSLWKHARNNTLAKDTVPKKTIRIMKSELLEHHQISIDFFINSYVEKLTDIPGDFRQQQIINQWKLISKDIIGEINVYTAELHVSSGTYIRSLVNEIGNNLGTGAVCLKIKRLKIGNYTEDNILT